MRHSTRNLRHSSLSLYLVPLALPLVLLCVPGARAQLDEEEATRETQEVILDEIIAPAPELPSIEFPAQLSSEQQNFDAEEGHRA